MRVSFSEIEEDKKIRSVDVPDGTLLRLEAPGEMYHGSVYAKVAGAENLINLSTGGKSYSSRNTDKIFVKLPAGFTATLVQE